MTLENIEKTMYLRRGHGKITHSGTQKIHFFEFF